MGISVWGNPPHDGAKSRASKLTTTPQGKKERRSWRARASIHKYPKLEMKRGGGHLHSRGGKGEMGPCKKLSVGEKSAGRSIEAARKRKFRADWGGLPQDYI